MIFQQRTHSTLPISLLIEPAMMAFYIKSGEEFSADKNINEEAEERASVSQKSCPSIANDPLESGRHKLTGKEIPNENDASLHGNSSPGFEVAA